MLNVYLIRLRFISARLLASTPSISKGLRKGYFIMLLLKILNVPIPPRTAVFLVSSVFALQTRRYKMYRDVHFVPCLRYFFVRS